MLSSLVISSSSNAVKFSSLFRSLGVEVSFIILDQTRETIFLPFRDHRMYFQGVVHYLHPDYNAPLISHQENFKKTESFIESLKNYFLEDLNFKRPSNPYFRSTESLSNPIVTFEKEDVIDLKYIKNLKNVQLEIKNKGLISFDHLFVEQTDSCLEFVKSKSETMVKPLEKSDLVWICYKYKLSAELSREDFWFLENDNYQSIFDNCFYLQPRHDELHVWALVPDHQILNQQFHDDFQERLRAKIEAKFGFVSLSFLKVSESNIHLMNSQRWRVSQNNRISGFPCFSFYSQEDVHDWFSHFSREFNKKHKIKITDQRVSL